MVVAINKCDKHDKDIVSSFVVSISCQCCLLSASVVSVVCVSISCVSIVCISISCVSVVCVSISCVSVVCVSIS